MGKNALLYAKMSHLQNSDAISTATQVVCRYNSQQFYWTNQQTSCKKEKESFFSSSITTMTFSCNLLSLYTYIQFKRLLCKFQQMPTICSARMKIMAYIRWHSLRIETLRRQCQHTFLSIQAPIPILLAQV